MISTPIRVLMAIKDAENFKGSAVQMWHLVAALRERGVVVRVVSQGQTAGRGGAFLGENDDFAALHAPRSRHFARALTRYLDDHLGEFDVLHVHGHGALSTICGRAARRKKIPMLVKVTAAGAGSRLDSWEKRVRKYPFLKWLVARHSDYWIAISRETKRGLLAMGIEKSRIFEIPNGVSPHFAPLAPDARLAARAVLGLSPNAVIVSSVGSLSPRKRMDLVLEAFALAARKQPNLYLWLIGDGPQRETLGELAFRRGVQDRVRFWGNLEREKLAHTLPLADIFALTSRIEGLSNALLEAMRCGLVPITNFSSGNADLIEQGVDGALVDAEQITEIAQILENWAHNPLLRAQMSARVRQKTAPFAIETVAQSYHDLYREILRKS